MSIEQRESSGTTQIPLKGVVGPDGKVRPSPALHPATSPATTAVDQGPDPVLPEPRPVPDIISQILIDGFPNPDPRYRYAQIQWAREVLWSVGQPTPYRTLVACRVMIDLSRDADERMVAARIQRDAVARLRRDEILTGPLWHLRAWAIGSVMGGLFCALVVLLVVVVRAQ